MRISKLFNERSEFVLGGVAGGGAALVLVVVALLLFARPPESSTAKALEDPFETRRVSISVQQVGPGDGQPNSIPVNVFVDSKNPAFANVDARMSFSRHDWFNDEGAGAGNSRSFPDSGGITIEVREGRRLVESWIRLYYLEPRSDRRTPVVEIQAEKSCEVHLAQLPPGRYIVRLEEDLQPNRVVLAGSRLQVERGLVNAMSINLSAGEVLPWSEVVVDVSIPSLDDREPPVTGIYLAPLIGEGRSDHDNTPLVLRGASRLSRFGTSVLSWGPLQVLPGRYQVTVLPMNYVEQGVVLPGRSKLALNLPVVRQRTIRIVDAETNELVELSDLAMRATSSNGDPGPVASDPRSRRDSWTNPLQAFLPSCNIIADIEALGYKPARKSFSLDSMDEEITLSLDRGVAVQVSLEVDGNPRNIDTDWLRSIRVFDPRGDLVPVTGYRRSLVEDGRVSSRSGTLYLHGNGLLRFEAPGPPGTDHCLSERLQVTDAQDYDLVFHVLRREVP